MSKIRTASVGFRVPPDPLEMWDPDAVEELVDKRVDIFIGANTHSVVVEQAAIEDGELVIIGKFHRNPINTIRFTQSSV